MVATVGSISIDLATNAASFANGFRKSASTVDRESSRMARAVGSVQLAANKSAVAMTGFIGGLAAGGALAAVSSVSLAFVKARQAISDFEEIGNRSRVAGLRSDDFQALSFAANQADISQESLNTGLEIFAKNVGLAKVGNGALVSSLKELNPELLKAILSAKTQEERLNLVADAMSKTTDETRKAALATAVFGRGGIDMVRLFDGGAASLARFKQNAKDLGIIIPDNLIQKAGELDDKLSTLATVTDVNLKQALVTLAPILVASAEGLAAIAKAISAMGTAIDAFAANKSLDSFLKIFELSLEEGGPTDKFRDMINQMTADSNRGADEIVSDMVAINQKIIDLQNDAFGGIFNDLAIERERDVLKGLEAELISIGVAATTAANAIRSKFAQAFREAENASMSALNNMSPGGSYKKPLPRVTSFGSSGDDDGRFGQVRNLDKLSGELIEGVDETTESTDRIDDSVTRADSNNQRYLDELGSSIGSGLSSLGQTINAASLTEAEAILKAMGSSLMDANIRYPGGANLGLGSTFFGNERGNNKTYSIDTGSSSSSSSSSFGGYGISDAPAIQSTSTSSTPFVDNSSVAGADTAAANAALANNTQPIVLNYNAAAGENDKTSRQNARSMWDQLTREVGRA